MGPRRWSAMVLMCYIMFTVYITQAKPVTDPIIDKTELLKEDTEGTEELSDNMQTDFKDDTPSEQSNLPTLHSRHRRGVFLTDNGLGSRIQASSTAARMALADSMFGSGGPGKRSGWKGSAFIPYEIYQSYDIYDTAEPGDDVIGQYSDMDDSFIGRLVHKRPYSGDSGYGSRIQIGEQVAKDKGAYKSVFGSNGAGRR